MKQKKVHVNFAVKEQFKRFAKSPFWLDYRGSSDLTLKWVEFWASLPIAQHLVLGERDFLPVQI